MPKQSHEALLKKRLKASRAHAARQILLGAEGTGLFTMRLKRKFHAKMKAHAKRLIKKDEKNAIG